MAVATTTTTSTLAVLALIFAMAGSSGASYCVCKGGDMQKAIDYACGNGADCTAIRPNGACYSANSLQAACSYAVNSYYQKKSASGATCDFQGVATLTNTPTGLCGSSGSSTSTGAPGSSSSPSMTTPSTSTPGSSTTTPVTPVSSGSSPYTTPGTGTGTGTGTGMGTGSPSSVLGGVGTGLAPSGVGMNDESGASGVSPPAFAFAVMLCSLVALLWS